jgi:hypothetical protein
MPGLRDRFAAAKAAFTYREEQHDPRFDELLREPGVEEADDDSRLPQPAPIITPFPSLQGGAAAQPPTSPRSAHFERQRALIDAFDEDYADRWDKVKLFAAKLVALVLPVIAVLAIGDELGTYFSRFSGGTSSQVLIAYAGEAALAALTYILGSIFGRNEKSIGHYVKLAITFGVWLLLILASAWGQWAVAASSLSAHAGIDLKVAIWLRIGMACMLDATSVAIMFWRGKSLSKYLAQQQQKANATIQVNEAELTIQRAQAAAVQREKEDALYLKGKEQAQNVVMRVQELQGEALIEQARNALQLPEGTRDNGRKLRGSGW